MRSLTKGAFTLLELLVVIIVMGILASIALPGYLRTRERTLAKEAISNLKLIAAAERIYKMENGTWYPPTVGASERNISNINTNLKLSLTDKYWQYVVTRLINNAWALANRQGTGGYLNCEYRIYFEANPNGEPAPAVSDNCP